MGFRYNEAEEGNWNLDLKGVLPALSTADAPSYGGATSVVDLPAFTDATGEGSVVRRGVPVTEVAGRTVTTVFDLMLAQYGVGREGLPGQWASGYDDVETLTPRRGRRKSRRYRRRRWPGSPGSSPPTRRSRRAAP